jgi:polar amino acid transport system substrate-binding protein
VYLTRHLLAARAGDPAVVRDLQDLVRLGALVTSQRGSVFTDALKAAGVRVDDATDDNGVNLHKMLAGHGRFAYLNELTLKHYIRSEGLGARVRVLPVVLGAEAFLFLGQPQGRSRPRPDARRRDRPAQGGWRARPHCRALGRQP